MKQGTRARALCLAAALSCAAVFSLSAEQPGKVHLAIGYIPHVQFTPLYVGMEKGFYRDEGIDLEISYGFGVDVFSLLQAGKIDLGLSDSDQLILAGARDLGLQAVYQYYQKYPVSIVVKAGGITEPSQLAGKSIGTPEMYGTSYIGLALFLQKYSLAGKVNVVKIGYTQEAALRGGKVDAAVCFFNNEPILLAMKGFAVRQWDVKDFSDIVGASFISSREVIARRAGVLERFARATSRAMAYTMDNRDEAFTIARAHIGNIRKEDEPFLRKVLDATCTLFPSPRGYGAMDAAQYQRSIQELVSVGLVSQGYPADRILYRAGG